MADDQDKSQLDNPVYELANYNPFQLNTHLHGRYGTLEQADFTIIFDRLKASKMPMRRWQKYTVICTLFFYQLDNRRLLNSLTTFFQEALRDDFQGRAAVDIYIRLHP
eukprot:gene34558-44669_t